MNREIDPERDLYRKDTDRLLKSYLGNSELPAGDKKFLEEFNQWLLSKELGKSRALRMTYDVGNIARNLKKPLRTLNEADAKQALVWINGLTLSKWTKISLRLALKRIYQFNEKYEDLKEFPPSVAWIRLGSRDRNQLTPKDLLTQEEILLMAKKAHTPRDEALVYVLFELGGRIAEILCMAKKDIVFSPSGCVAFLDGKTGPRECPIEDSVPYLRQYLSSIKNNGPNSPLWVSSRDKTKPLNYWECRNMLKDLAKEAGITKRIYPHLFRHSQASLLAPKVTDSVLKSFLGWGMGSNMPQTYIHLGATNKDVANAIRKARGKQVDEKPAHNKLAPTTCWNCSSDISPVMEYCHVCKMPLTEAGKITRMKEQALGLKVLELLKQTPEGSQMVKRLDDNSLEDLIVVDGLKAKKNPKSN